MAKLTPFGREVRKHRVDRGETQSDVARALGVSVAFWSSIETGRRNIPSDLLQKIIEHFRLSNIEEKRFRHLVEVSKEEVKVNLQRLSDPGREVVVGLARKFEENSLSAQQWARLRDILNSED